MFPLKFHKFEYLYVSEDEGKQTESDFNSRGPGQAWFIYGDVTKEADIKVFKICNVLFGFLRRPTILRPV